MRRRALARGMAALISLAMMLATAPGCAPVPPGSAPAARPAPPAAPRIGGAPTPPSGGPSGEASGTARPGVPVGNTASGGSIVSRGSQPAVVDSGPSAEALAVLATIPEPLAPAERVPPPAAGRSSGGGELQPSGIAPPADSARGSAPGTTVSGAAARDTATIAAEDSLIPVPAPTEPLGDRPGTLERAVADTFPVMPPPVSPPPAAARPDSCWRVQIAAPAAKGEADLRRQAAESVLLVPFVVEHGQKLYKVKTRDCLAREAAALLRTRALQSGFKGAFLVVETGGSGKAPGKPR